MLRGKARNRIVCITYHQKRLLFLKKRCFKKNGKDDGRERRKNIIAFICTEYVWRDHQETEHLLPQEIKPSRGAGKGRNSILL